MALGAHPKWGKVAMRYLKHSELGARRVSTSVRIEASIYKGAMQLEANKRRVQLMHATRASQYGGGASRADKGVGQLM